MSWFTPVVVFDDWGRFLINNICFGGGFIIVDFDRWNIIEVYPIDWSGLERNIRLSGFVPLVILDIWRRFFNAPVELCGFIIVIEVNNWGFVVFFPNNWGWLVRGELLTGLAPVIILNFRDWGFDLEVI